MRLQQIIRALALSAALYAAPPVDARLVRLEITQREVVAGGEHFGTAGAYQRLTGIAHFEVDTTDRRNAVVFDLDKAPRNARGLVEFSADIEAPGATLTGWNTRSPEFGGDDLCDLLGSTIPLARTQKDAKAAGDPRPALEELYRDHEGYVSKVRQAAQALEKRRLMLSEDVELTVRDATESDVLR